jgi:hypothetical protein
MFAGTILAIVAGSGQPLLRGTRRRTTSGMKTGIYFHFPRRESVLLFLACLTIFRARNTSIGTGRPYRSIIYRTWFIVFDARQKS